MKKLLFLTLLCCYSQLIYAQVKPTEIPLYENQIPNEKPGKDEETSTTENNILLFRDVRNPTLSVFLPPKEKANGTAVVICPGGGYWVVADCPSTGCTASIAPGKKKCERMGSGS